MRSEKELELIKTLKSRKTLIENGARFGLLTVREFKGKNEKTHLLYRCECECGGEKITSGSFLRAGDVRSCGCLQNSPHKWMALQAKQRQSAKQNKIQIPSWFSQDQQKMVKSINKNWGGIAAQNYIKMQQKFQGVA